MPSTPGPVHTLLRVANKVPGVRHALRLARTARQVPGAVRLVTDPEASRTFHPEAPRKGTARMALDNVGYLLRHGEVDPHYFQYGLDRIGKTWNDVIPYAEFRRLRDRRNVAAGGSGFDYLCLLRDKFVFAQFAESLGYRTPRNLAFLKRGAMERLSPRETLPLDALLEADLDGFCKPFDGILGRGAFALRIEGGRPVVNGKPATLDALRVRLSGRYLLQERMTQHEALARFHPASVNALRVITVLEGGAARLFSTHLRVGAHGEPTNSVGTGGGFAIVIDSETGRLRGRGLTRDGFHDRHPDSDVVFDGYELPYFDEAVALACRLHEDVRGLHSVGWDVAIAPDGPVFIEGNDNWGGGITMTLEPDFKERFLALGA
ncbi:sugar-transfer associated ATP-grasp domain-containing protein [Rubrivirga sp.]|uniref:sugar-transfer associated ATP-grasp domain-containing protein n=1 Tax=Rubrivirga sp. TaxID=1885344 RepID=UPI003B519896